MKMIEGRNIRIKEKRYIDLESPTSYFARLEKQKGATKIIKRKRGSNRIL